MVLDIDQLRTEKVGLRYISWVLLLIAICREATLRR